MAIELDHFLILTEPGAPQAEQVSAVGLVEGTSNDHPGQGTANRRFCFANAFLELLYIRDADEAANGPGSRMRLVERASGNGASPFGIIVRRSNASNEDPFAGWRYYPDYFGADQYFHVGENSAVLEEPLCVCLPAMPPASTWQPLSPEPFSEVTELRVSVPAERPSAVLEEVARCERITLIVGEPQHMEIVFNEGEQGQSRDLRPDLPLGICW